MGLDMYLYVTKYTSKYNAKELNNKLRALFCEVPDSDNLESIEIKREVGYWRKSNQIHNNLLFSSFALYFEVIEIKREVGYWRKSNQIHKWFVDNVQKGIDDCKYYYVSREKLQELLNIINKLLKNRDEEEAKKLLPTTEGFFFGTDEVDKTYWDDLMYTQKLLSSLLNINELNTWDFEYLSSW